VLSAVAMVYAVARVPFTPGSGVIADVVSPLAVVVQFPLPVLRFGSPAQVIQVGIEIESFRQVPGHDPKLVPGRTPAGGLQASR
jgi:hypothetical protein